MLKEKKCKYLKDEPVALTNSLVTKSIVEEITQKQKNGKIIGILGGWGSGKSSIIEGIKTEIGSKGKKENCQFVEYDAWKNEKFPFKLGFLEELLKKYKECSRDKSQIKTFEDDLSELKQLKEVQKAKEYSLINLPNALIAISFLFYPLAFDLISNQKMDEVLYSFGISTIWKIKIYNSAFWIFFGGILALIANYFLDKERGIKRYIKSLWENLKKIDMLNLLTLLLISVIIGTCFSVVNYAFILYMPLIIWAIFNLKKFISKMLNDGKDFYILSGVSPHTESLLTINKTPDPSYKDFYDLYSKIVKKFVETNQNKNLVIVIDNIDRIGAEDAKSIWSSLKGMVLKNNSVHIIVPIDEEQASKIFKDNEGDESYIKADSFIQKTFDILYRVPPRHITDADKIWKEKLEEAFDKEFTEEQISQITSIFETRDFDGENFAKSSYKGPATPRKIIKIINEVVPYEKENKFSSIKLNTKFAFVIHYNNICKQLQVGNITNLLPNNNILTNEIDSIELAQLYYQSDYDIALMLAKKDDLYKKITSDHIDENDDDLKYDWAWRVLSSTLPQKQYASFEILLNTANNLVNLKKINDNQQLSSYMLKQTMDRMLGLKNLISIPNNASDKLSNIFKQISNPEQYKNLIKVMFSIDANSDLGRGYVAKEWIKVLTTIMENLDVSRDEIYNMGNDSIPEDLYLSAIPQIESKDLNKYDLSILHPDVKVPENIEKLPAEAQYAHCRFFIQRGNDEYTAWDKLEATIYKIIKQKSKEYRYLEIIANSIRNGYQSYIETYVKSNDFLNILYNHHSNYDSFALALAIYVTVSPEMKEFKNYPNARILENAMINDDNILNQFITEFLNLNNHDINKLLNIPVNKTRIIGYMTEDNLAKLDISGTNIDEFLKRYSTISNTEAYEILRKITDEQNIIPFVEKIVFSKENEILMSDLSRLIDSHSCNNFKNYFATVINWKEEIINITEIFKTAIYIGYSNSEFRAALKDSIPTIILTKFSDFMELEDIYLKKIANLSLTNQIINDLFNTNIKNENLSDSKFIKLFNKQIINWLKKGENDKEEVFVDFIIKIKDENWIYENKEIIIKYVKSSKINQNNFVEMWRESEQISKSYEDIFMEDSEVSEK